ncbi:MAG: NAD-dependent succinate-semialdehyde dehydrogenase [Rhodospirillales bacterium]|nr:NAD-dependent succinate-semialdehyde dehydrogenase [Rhodospirillales bacterium]
MYPTPELFIDGNWRAASGTRVVPVVNPANEEILGEVRDAGPADVAAILASAEAGFARWRSEAPWKRSDVIRRIAALMRERADEIARLLTLEVGKPLAEAKTEVVSSADHFDWAADEARRVYGYAVGARAPESRLRVEYEPVGIALALTAWNFPINLAARKICMALAAGCSVIVRPAEEAPACIAALIRCCADAGVPPGVVNLVFGSPENAVVPFMEAAAVRKVSFTGSTRVGKLLIGQSAGTVKRLTMELGGHSPVLVLEDAGVDAAAKTAAAAKFRNAGQVCVAPSRFYVHRSIAGRFTERMVEEASAIRVGDGMMPGITMGPMATSRQRDRAEAMVEDARRAGARVLCGGSRPKDLNRGYFYAPTVLADVPDTAAIMTEEPFAPVAPIIPVASTAEAIAHANRLEMGLAAYVFTQSLEQATRVSEAMQAGVVGVNTCAVAFPETPFGGIKQSGYGREGGDSAIYEYLNTKFVHTRLTA